MKSAHPNPDDNQAERQSHRLTLLRALGMLAAAAVLLLSSQLLIQAPCWGCFLVIGVLAWPVWRYRTEYLLLRRRLVLSAVARAQSRVRSWLWRGSISKAIQAVVSFSLVWLLLILVSQLSKPHWALLAADALILALVVAPVSRRLRDDITTQHLNTVARHWPLFVSNGVVLTAAIMVLDFFIVGAADSRHLVWHQVAVRAFTDSNDAAVCVLWGASAGLLGAVEALAWHSSQLIIPELPDVTAKLMAWLFFLLRAGTLAYLFTALLLGTAVILERRLQRPRGAGGKRTFSRAFFLTILVLALPFFYATIKLKGLDPEVFEQGVENAAGWLDPCQPNKAARQKLISRLDARIEVTRRRAVDAIDSRVDAGLAPIFALTEEGIDSFLDWYFTVHGEYQRLASALTSDVTAAMREKLEQYLFAGTDFDVRLVALDEALADTSARQFADLLPQLGSEVQRAPCDIGGIALTPLGDIERDTLRASAAASSGLGAGLVASKMIAKKSAAAVAAKLAAKKSFQTGAALTSKTLVKKGSSSLLSAGLGTAICAPSGPVAVFCGVTAGLITWLSVDKALVEIDEVLNRETMRQDLLQVLADQKNALGEQLKQKHRARVDNMAARASDAVQRTFIPYEDGMD